MARPSEQDRIDLYNFLEEVRTDFISQYNAKGMRASGYAADSLRVENKQKPRLVGAEYWAFLFSGQGRRPGRFPPVQNIIDWIEDKGITVEDSINQTAFLIGRKIAQEGTEIYKRPSEGIDLKKIVNQRLLDTAGKIARRKANEILRPFKK